MKEAQTKHDIKRLVIYSIIIIVFLLALLFISWKFLYLALAFIGWKCWWYILYGDPSFYVYRINVKDGIEEEIALYDTFLASVEHPQNFNENSEQSYYMINFHDDIKGKVSLATWDDVSNNWSDCELFEINDKEYKFNLPNELNEEENVNYKFKVNNKEFYFTIVNSSKTD